MPVTIDINEQFGYVVIIHRCTLLYTILIYMLRSLVLAVASSSFLVNAMHMLTTSRFRKASGVPYPQSYASEEEAAKNKAAFKFNCGTSSSRVSSR